MSFRQTLDKRLYLASLRLRGGARNALSGLSGALTGQPTKQDVLTPQERAHVSQFANDEAFSDRNQPFNFQARDPVSGRLGNYSTTVSHLLLIEPSYDEAKRTLESILGRLVRDGIVTRVKPAAPPNVTRYQHGRTVSWNDDGDVLNVPYGGIGDPRLLTGSWADWPRYADLKQPGYTEPATAFGYTRFASGPFLPGMPIPRDWNHLFPCEKLWDASRFPHEAFEATMAELAEKIVLMVKGANGNPEWHPAIVHFLNGVEPYYHTSGVWDRVEARYQNKQWRPYVRLTRGQAVQNAGLTPVGRGDAMWRSSLTSRQPRAFEERHSGGIGNNWAAQYYADAIADFMVLVNLAQFLIDLGATAHVHACLEHHAAMATKAYHELGLTAGAGLSGYLAGVARERQAREARAQSQTPGLGLQLVSGPSTSSDRMIANQVLNGLVVASAQLFAANPIVGAVATAITVVAILITNLILGTAFECNGERLLIRDSRAVVREVDLMGCTGTSGDMYGGNLLPHSRQHAIEGRPVIRVKDALGREL